MINKEVIRIYENNNISYRVVVEVIGNCKCTHRKFSYFDKKFEYKNRVNSCIGKKIVCSKCNTIVARVLENPIEDKEGVIIGVTRGKKYLELDERNYFIGDIDSNNIVGKIKEPVIALGFTRAGLDVDYKGNAINDDMSFINENFKIEK